MEGMRLGAKDGRNGARFILKREKKGKIADFLLLFAFLLLFFQYDVGR